MGEHQRMAKRDQIRRALGRHDPGDAGDAEHVALFVAAAAHLFEGPGQHADPAGGDRDPPGAVLGADIDHVRLAVLIKMGKVSHCSVFVVCLFALMIGLRLLFEQI